MATDYAYITLVKLENYVGMDYSAIDATQFSDAKVEATISLAEKIVTSYLKKDAAQTVTDGIEVATTLIAAKMMHDKMVRLGYDIDDETPVDLLAMSTMTILRTFLKDDIGVDSIPMSGANNDIGNY